MTDKEVLKKAIEMAIKNGYNPNRVLLSVNQIDLGVNKVTVGWVEFFRKTEQKDYPNFSTQYFKREINTILFSHDFAKAFFPDGEKIVRPGTYIQFSEDEPLIVINEEVPLYKYHLMTMVRKENPINYLRKFIEDE